MKKGNKSRPIRYRNFYGLNFLFADRVFNKIAEKNDVSVQKVKDFSILYYIQKYVIKSNVIVITQLSHVCVMFGYDNLGVTSVRNTLRELKDKGKIEYYGERYHLNNTTTQFISSYSYWMHFYTANFHELVEERREMLKEHHPPKRRYKKRKKKNEKT